MVDTKTTDNKGNLFQYLIKDILKKDGDVLKFPEDIASVHSAATGLISLHKVALPYQLAFLQCKKLFLPYARSLRRLPKTWINVSKTNQCFLKIYLLQKFRYSCI